jgi:putative transposase
LKTLAVEFPGNGYRRMRLELKREGLVVNHKRVHRLMKALGLMVRPRRRWVRTTNSDHGLPVFRNLLQGLRIERINQVWAADLTYIRLGHGFVYLAVIIDLYSRKVVGWSLGPRITSALALEALKAALERRGPVPGCIHHSDRGVQYAAGNYVQALQEAGMTPSMSRKGNPYDNAFVESFMKTLKVEEVYLREYRTYQDVVDSVPYFIEAVYNAKRLHSSLGYRSPQEFETETSKTFNTINSLKGCPA